MGRGAKKILPGKSSSVVLIDKGVFKERGDTDWGKSILEDRGLPEGHSEKAELLSDALLDVLGPAYSDVFARLQQVSFRTLGSGLLVEYIEGETMAERLSLARREAKKNDDYDSLETSKAQFLLRDEEVRKGWVSELRRIVFLDTILANSDRHPGNVIFSESGPKGIDQGLSFTPEKGLWQTKEGPILPSFDADLIVDQTGGMRLLKEEKEALESILSSDWLKRVRETVGEEAAAEAKNRILYMLEEGKLYPLITGSGIEQESDRFQRRRALQEKFSKVSV